jgi:hypothetical protein
METFHLKWVNPPGLGSAKVSWMERPSSSQVQNLNQALSCLYPWWGPNNHLMGSLAPWRSELIISPCVPSPIGTCPLGMVLHIKNFALHGFISHRDHNNVNHVSSLMLSNICIKALIHHSIAQRHYKDLQYRAEEKNKVPYWASIHKERKVSKGYHPSHVKRGDVVKGCPDIRVE